MSRVVSHFFVREELEVEDVIFALSLKSAEFVGNVKSYPGRVWDLYIGHINGGTLVLNAYIFHTLCDEKKRERFLMLFPDDFVYSDMYNGRNAYHGFLRIENGEIKVLRLYEGTETSVGVYNEFEEKVIEEKIEEYVLMGKSRSWAENYLKNAVPMLLMDKYQELNLGDTLLDLHGKLNLKRYKCKWQ